MARTRIEDEQALQLQVEEKKKALDEQESGMIALVNDVFGKKMASDVAGGFLSAGMPVELLKMTWGEPEEVKLPEPGYEDMETWYYEPNKDQKGKMHYNARVLVNKNKIVEWSN